MSEDSDTQAQVAISTLEAGEEDLGAGYGWDHARDEVRDLARQAKEARRLRALVRESHRAIVLADRWIRNSLSYGCVRPPAPPNTPSETPRIVRNALDRVREEGTEPPEGQGREGDDG